MNKVTLIESPTDWGWAKILAKKESQALESGIFCCQPGNSLSLHTHDEGEEYCYLFQGNAVFVIDGEETPIATGECIRIPHNSVHRCYNPSKTEPFTSFYLVCP